MTYLYRKPEQHEIASIIIMKNEVKKEVEKLQLPIWLNGYPQDDLIEEDIEKEYGRILEVNNKIVAYASYYPALYDYDPGTFPRDDLMSFGRIMTKPSEQGHGYANILIKEMINESIQNHHPGMGILVDDINKKAIHLYQKYGFTKIGTGVFPWATLDIYVLMFKYE